MFFILEIFRKVVGRKELSDRPPPTTNCIKCAPQQGDIIFKIKGRNTLKPDWRSFNLTSKAFCAPLCGCTNVLEFFF